MNSNFKLRQCIDAHDNDVKSLFVLSDGSSFLSASRDLSIKLWQEQNDRFEKTQHYLFHKSFISVVHFMEPCLGYPNGLIFSAGYDKIINGYFINSSEVQFSLVGHTNAVTSITTTNNCELISGSMDGSAILWDLTTLTIKMNFKGHKHGIWSIILLNSFPEHFLTASADKEIFLWNLKSKEIVKKYIGHSDCVRGLLEIPQSKQFLSCSNDSTIRLWCLKTGSLLKIFGGGHNSFIYSIARISDERFVSCGEENLLCIWNLNNVSCPIQRIHVNALSVWSVSVLNNGDIISGSSDGMVRLFSENSLLQNGLELESKFPNKLTDDYSSVMSLESVGIEMLSLPGNYDHQLLRVRDEDCDVLYEWSSSQDLWVKRKTLENSKPNKTKTHDHIFSIDIKDGEPPLKLHYNNGQDPWVVAKQFLDDNDLSPMFLDQVANFIIANSKQQITNLSSSTNFNDPYTGSSRYVSSDSVQSTAVQYQFPHKSYFKYDKINAIGLSKKLQEFCVGARLPDVIRNNIENIQTLSTDQAEILCNWVIDKLPLWNDDQMFPLIDILRMLVRESACNSICFTHNEFLVKLISRTIGSQTGVCSKGNTLTIIKLMVNAFLHLPGEGLMNYIQKQIEDDLYSVAQSNTDKNILIAIANWLLNLSVSLNVRREEYHRNEAVELCFRFLETFKLKHCSEAIHLMLITIGTLVCNNNSFSFRETLTMNVYERLKDFNKIFNDEIKWGVDVSNCSQQLGILIASLEFVNF